MNGRDLDEARSHPLSAATPLPARGNRDKATRRIVP